MTTTVAQTKTANPFVTPDVEKNAVVITRANLISGLMEQKGSKFITIVTETEPRMRKTGNPFVGATKVSRVNGRINANYDNNVLARLAKEGKDASEFTRGESWHEAITRADGSMTPFCAHKKTGAIYLRFVLENAIDSHYFDATGVEIDKAAINPFLYESNYSNQGLGDNPVMFLVYSMESVKALTIDGMTYLVR